MQAFQKRQTAFKLWISDIVNSSQVEKDDISCFESRGVEFSRVNVIGSVVFRFVNDDKTYCSVTLDDGSGAVRLKAWADSIHLLQNLNLGDLILVVGRPREYESEIYINPEIIRKVEPNWELVRKLELFKQFGKPVFTEKVVSDIEVEDKKEFVEEMIVESPRQKIMNFINKYDEGVSITEVISNSNLPEEQATSIIKELLQEGEVFEPKSNFLKVI